MRILLSAIAVLLATSAQAKDLSFYCATEEGATTDVGEISVVVEGIMKANGERRELSTRNKFFLGCEEDASDPRDCWAATPEKYGKVKNQVPYKPRKYKGYRKFSLDLDSDDAYGSFDLIFPKEELLKDKKEFTAFMIMTYINDHFGGTVSLNCKKTKAYEFPTNYVNLHECADRVIKMVSVVNICGDDDVFHARGCKQTALGQEIVCRGLTFPKSGDGCAMDIKMGPMCKRNISTVIVRDDRETM